MKARMSIDPDDRRLHLKAMRAAAKAWRACDSLPALAKTLLDFAVFHRQKARGV